MTDPENDFITRDSYGSLINFDPDSSGGGLLDADDDREGSEGFLHIEWNSSGANSYSPVKQAAVQVF